MASKHLDLAKLGEILHQLVHPSDRDLHLAVDDLIGQGDDGTADSTADAKTAKKDGE